MRNIHVKLFYNSASGSGGLKKKFTDDGRRPITIVHLSPIKSMKNYPIGKELRNQIRFDM